MMSEQPCFYHVDAAGVATLTLQRPEVHNALNGASVNRLTELLLEIDNTPSIRVLILDAAGKNFCAGADLKWMQSTKDSSGPGLLLAKLMYTLHGLSKPSIALVQGAAYGGGAGLVGCCDLALAAENAHFCFSEVRLGLIPSVISPYIVRAIGARSARRYFLTAERFTAEEACRMGLIHEVVAVDLLLETAEKFCLAFIAGGPIALSCCKKMLDDVVASELDSKLMNKTAQWLNELRQGEEAQEGIRAFFAKRKASWNTSDKTQT